MTVFEWSLPYCALLIVQVGPVVLSGSAVPCLTVNTYCFAAPVVTSSATSSAHAALSSRCVPLLG